MHAVAQHHGMAVPVARIRQYASTDRKGTNVLGMVDAAVRMGFVAKGVRGPFESLAKIPKPAIAHVVRKDGIQHFVVLVQVTAKHVYGPSRQSSESLLFVEVSGHSVVPLYPLLATSARNKTRFQADPSAELGIPSPLPSSRMSLIVTSS